MLTEFSRQTFSTSTISPNKSRINLTKSKNLTKQTHHARPWTRAGATKHTGEISRTFFVQRRRRGGTNEKKNNNNKHTLYMHVHGAVMCVVWIRKCATGSLTLSCPQLVQCEKYAQCNWWGALTTPSRFYLLTLNVVLTDIRI